MLVLCRLLEKREESSGHEVDLRNIGAVDVIPIFEGGFLVIEHLFLHALRAASFSIEGLGADTSVVDENVEVFLFLGDLVIEGDNVFLVGDVGGDRDDLTGDALAIGLGDSVQLLLGASRDVDLRM